MEHSIPFTKRILKFTLINLLFHLVFHHNHVVLKDMYNNFYSVNRSIYYVKFGCDMVQKIPWIRVIFHKLLHMVSFGSSMISGIIPLFTKGKPLCSLVCIFRRKPSLIGFQALVDHFYLAIHFRMICNAHIFLVTLKLK